MNPYFIFLPQKSENVRPHSSNSIEIKCNAIIIPAVKMRPNPGHSTPPPLGAHSQEMQTPKHLG